MTQYIGVIGYPLKHSISPDFQQAALDYYKLDIQYRAWEIQAQELLSAVDRMRQPQNLGANVTVPYKETVITLLDEVDNVASLIGAVNTIVNRDGKLAGTNTDAYGFIQSLRRDGKFEPGGKKVVVLGAGGAARAVSFALIREKVYSLAIINRTWERAEKLAKSLTGHVNEENGSTRVHAVPWSIQELQQMVNGCQLLVNCTTMGMNYSSQEGQSPLLPNMIPQGALVYDLVYNPPETPLLSMAKEAGAAVLGGLPMLVYQGAAAFELWVGKEAPVDIMFAAARQALEKDRR